VSGTMTNGVVALSIPAKAEYLTVCRLALAGLSQVHAVEPEALADVKLALTEACSNSIRHAYREGRDGDVEIRYELDDGQIAVEVRDVGGGFPTEEESAAADELDEGGLGLAIIRALSDEVEIESHAGGSRLRFVKYLN
jgi:serine/threonine-protein kinase RsbW